MKDDRCPGIAINDGTFAETSSLDQKMAAAAAAGAGGLGLWASRLPAGAWAPGPFHACREIGRLGLAIVELNFLRDWMTAEGRALEQKLEEAASLARVSARFGCRDITLACFEPVVDRAVATRNLELVARVAGELGRRVCVEFLPWGAVATVRAARELIEGARAENVALVIDTFHFFMGGSRLEDLGGLSGEQIGLVHFSDFAPTRSKYTDLFLKTRRERVPPGLGEFPLVPFLRCLRACRYRGWLSVEILSEAAAAALPEALALTAVQRTAAVLREAYEDSGLEAHGGP